VIATSSRSICSLRIGRVSSVDIVGVIDLILPDNLRDPLHRLHDLWLQRTGRDLMSIMNKASQVCSACLVNQCQI
jgi:hypothetical protein